MSTTNYGAALGGGYAAFLASKAPRIEAIGVDVADDVLSPHLFPFARAIVAWGLRRGRAAFFCDTGMTKTRMQIDWARHSGARSLIVAPLGVVEQTVAEGGVMGVDMRIIARPSEASNVGVHITNYEKLRHFIGSEWDAIALDESSILKSLDGKTRTMLLREFTGIPRRLCCTATPAPNDTSELGNHAEFLGVMSSAEMLASFFVHISDNSRASGWRLKGHAEQSFYRWLAQWSVYVRRPSDIGFSDEGWTLPPLAIINEIVPTDYRPDGHLFATHIGGVADRARVRRATLDARVLRAAEIIRAGPGQWLVWCGLNDEADALSAALGDTALNIAGVDTDDAKATKERTWRTGAVPTLITKPSIYGWGMNWQHCHQVMFLGLGDSYEAYYQAIRRCWRYGQQRAVDVVIVTSTAEGEIAANVRRKEQVAKQTAERVIAAMRDAQIEQITGSSTLRDDYVKTTESGEGWTAMLGDCVDRIQEIETGSVGLSVFSPPFASLYTYSASDRDMGNAKDVRQFMRHFRYLVPELLRVTMPGRRACVHVQQIAKRKSIDGIIGWLDFRALVVRVFERHGWIYDGEVVIDKNPQAQAIRTKSKQLMFVQKNKDSSWSRPAMADYILLFRHPGENPVPIVPDVSNEEWIRWARPIWYGINESDTLNAEDARSERDERHICPLQLGTIERCVRLWSNPGEIVLSPFGGIGSEGYKAQQLDRRSITIELKPEYFRVACRNLARARSQLLLFPHAR